MSHTPEPSTPEPSAPDPGIGERDARRQGLPNRVRRLMHPHRRTVVRGTVAAVIAIAILASVGGAIRTLRADGRAPIRPEGVDQLRADWVAELGSGPVTGMATDGAGIFASTDEGVLRVDVSCATTTGATPTPDAAPTPDATGATCEPAWRGPVPDGPLSVPAVFDGRVFAGSSEGRVYAFPADCAASCEPEWVGQAGDETVSQPAVNDDFVYVTSDRLYAFPSGCGTGDRICSPVWSAGIPGRPSPGPPALGGGLVVVTSSAAGGSVYAFPAVCSAQCDPVWAATTSGGPGGAALQGDTAYVAAGGRLLAFPLSCQGTCSPTWSGSFMTTSTVGPGAVDPPSPQGDLVYVGADDGVLWVFPASCSQPSCEPLQSFDVADTTLRRPSSLENVVYVTSAEGSLHAVDACDGSQGACQRPWSVELDAPTVAAAVVGDGAVYAGDDAGHLSAFTLLVAP